MLMSITQVHDVLTLVSMTGETLKAENIKKRRPFMLFCQKIEQSQLAIKETINKQSVRISAS